MNVVFYLSAAIAIAATAMVITRPNAMHALLYLIVSLLAVSLIFFTLGAPFIAALEVIVYAGAIMVLFIFAIMLLNLGAQAAAQEREWLRASNWIGPAVFALVLLGELVFVLARPGAGAPTPGAVPPEQVGASLFSTYLLGVELSSLLLMSSLIGAFHLGQARRMEDQRRREKLIEAKRSALEEGVPEASPEEAKVREAS